MKKNLLVLVLVLAAVALTTRLNRNSGQEAAWAALRQDETRCLETLWGEVPQVELLPTNGGVLMNLIQPFPDDVSPARRRWSYEVARLVARRHPQVAVVDIRVVDGANGQTISPAPDPEERTELLRRQRQAQADQIMPGTLVLLDIRYAPAPNDPAILQNRVEPTGARARAPRHQESSGAPHMAAPREVEAMDAAAPPVPQSTPVSSTCWLVTPSDPPPALVDALKPIERVVRLPNP